MKEPDFLPLAVVLLWEPVAERLGVSKVARSRGQFVEMYDEAGGRKARLSAWWRRRRAGFVARHMAQMRGHLEPLYDRKGMPTRRHLALVMWAYSPDPRGLAKAARAAGLGR